MRTPLTTHLIIKNDEDWVENAIKSILPLNGHILVADIGSIDNTKYICEKYNAKVTRMSLNYDMSQVRNRMVELDKQPWHLYLDPWEKILTGTEAIKQICTNEKMGLYRMPIIQGDMITKDIRLWHRESKAKFNHPLNEAISGDAEDVAAVIHQSQNNSRQSLNDEMLQKWKEKSPLDTNLLYMEASNLLIQKKWKEFINKAEHYLFLEKQDIMPTTMTHYYVAMVLCYAFSEYEAAIKHIAACIAIRPLMAEYWCLLGDIHYKKKEYEKAKTFYENALELGEQRTIDEWPTDVKKYKKYPKEMIQSCKDLLSKSRDFLIRK